MIIIFSDRKQAKLVFNNLFMEKVNIYSDRKYINGFQWVEFE